jgi:hypothetical protein
MPEIKAENMSRFLALADAVRQHELATGSRATPRRPRDHALYRRLQQLEQSLPIAGGAPQPGQRPGPTSRNGRGNHFQLHGH